MTFLNLPLSVIIALGVDLKSLNFSALFLCGVFCLLLFFLSSPAFSQFHYLSFLAFCHFPYLSFLAFCHFPYPSSLYLFPPFPYLFSHFPYLSSYETWGARFKFVLMLDMASYALIKHLTLFTECRFSGSCFNYQSDVLNGVVQETFKKHALFLCCVVQLGLTVSRQLTAKECASFVKYAWILLYCTTNSITFPPKEFVKFFLYTLLFLL